MSISSSSSGSSSDSALRKRHQQLDELRKSFGLGMPTNPNQTQELECHALKDIDRGATFPDPGVRIRLMRDINDESKGVDESSGLALLLKRRGEQSGCASEGLDFSLAGFPVVQALEQYKKRLAMFDTPTDEAETVINMKGKLEGGCWVWWATKQINQGDQIFLFMDPGKEGSPTRLIIAPSCRATGGVQR